MVLVAEGYLLTQLKVLCVREITAELAITGNVNVVCSKLVHSYLLFVEFFLVIAHCS